MLLFRPVSKRGRFSLPKYCRRIEVEAEYGRYFISFQFANDPVGETHARV